MLHVWHIYLHVNVGKDFSPMEHLGARGNPTFLKRCFFFYLDHLEGSTPRRSSYCRVPKGGVFKGGVTGEP